MLLLFPQPHRRIDWTQKHEFLDKELFSLVVQFVEVYCVGLSTVAVRILGFLTYRPPHQSATTASSVCANTRSLGNASLARIAPTAKHAQLLTPNS
jgi:hypothetical protein